MLMVGCNGAEKYWALWKEILISFIFLRIQCKYNSLQAMWYCTWTNRFVTTVVSSSFQCDSFKTTKWCIITVQHSGFWPSLHTKSVHTPEFFSNALKKTYTKEAHLYLWSSLLFYPLFHFEWCVRFITKEGFWCWWSYVVLSQSVWHQFIF